MDVRHKMQANEFQSSLMAYKNMLRANRCYDCSTLKSQRGATNAASWRAKEHADNEQKQMALAGEREEVCGSHIVLESHISALAHQEAADLGVVISRSHMKRRAVFLQRSASIQHNGTVSQTSFLDHSLCQRLNPGASKTCTPSRQSAKKQTGEAKHQRVLC